MLHLSDRIYNAIRIGNDQWLWCFLHQNHIWIYFWHLLRLMSLELNIISINAIIQVIFFFVAYKQICGTNAIQVLNMKFCAEQRPKIKSADLKYYTSHEPLHSRIIIIFCSSCWRNWWRCWCLRFVVVVGVVAVVTDCGSLYYLIDVEWTSRYEEKKRENKKKHQTPENCSRSVSITITHVLRFTTFWSIAQRKFYCSVGFFSRIGVTCIYSQIYIYHTLQCKLICELINQRAHFN